MHSLLCNAMIHISLCMDIYGRTALFENILCKWRLYSSSILITILHYGVDSDPVLDPLQQRTAYPLKYLSRNTCESKRNRKSLIACITYQSRPENNVIHLNYFCTRAKEMHICSLCFQIFPKSLFISPNLASPPPAYYLIAIKKLGGERREERDISTAMSLTSG